MEDVTPYPPHPIHRFNDWLHRSRMPVWLFSALLLIIPGVIQHLVAWQRGNLAFGEFNLYIGFASMWLVEIIIYLYWMERNTGPTFDAYKSMLNKGEEEIALLRYSFTTIPSRLGSLFMLIGAMFGTYLALITRSVSPEINYQILPLAVALWTIPVSLALVFLYQVVRQLSQINLFFSMSKKINLYNLAPIYSFSRYTAFIGAFVFIMVFITPLFLDPSSLENEIVAFQTVAWIALALAIFYLPMRGINRRIVHEKEQLLKNVTSRIESLYTRFHHSFEGNMPSESGEWLNMLTAFKQEKESIEAVPTWPWKPGTFATLISALGLPLLLGLLQRILASFFGF